MPLPYPYLARTPPQTAPHSVSSHDQKAKGHCGDPVTARSHPFEEAKRAEKIVAASRSETVELRSQIAKVEKRRQGLANRLRDPEIPALAARALYRELAEDETELQRLQQALSDTGERSNMNTGRRVADVRRAFEDARKRFADLRSPEQMNPFVADYILGKLVAHPDGSVTVENKETPANAEVSMLHIAGGRYAPRQRTLVLGTIQAVFWNQAA